MASIALSQISPGSAWQANGTVGWWMAAGDKDNWWGLSVRPWQANNRVRLEGGITAVSDNNLNQTTEFVVTMASPAGGGGGLVHVMAMKVSP